MQKYFIIIFCGLLHFGFSQNTFTNLEDALKNPESVKFLSLSKNRLKTFPVEIMKFSNLEYLDLSKNKLTTLPDTLRGLNNLKTLALNNNKLNQISEGITDLPNLKELYLARNPITQIPIHISKLDALVIFDCWLCHIDELPEEMKSLKNLKEIDLRQTYIREQDSDIYSDWWPDAKIQTTWGCNCGK
jgi:Leucine-rich repeat (LRR) protein